MVKYEEMENSMKRIDALSQRSFFHKTDWLAVVLILAVSLGLWAVLFFPRVTQRLQVEIYCDNVLTQTIPLPAEDKLLELSDRQMTLELKDNRIRVSETNCADQSCLRMGFIERAGQTIVCLPNRVVVQITGNGEPDSRVDGIAD